jgi:diguanylate cyclase (GGDEF)-like protein/PAS domain S-box-containing protein
MRRVACRRIGWLAALLLAGFGAAAEPLALSPQEQAWIDSHPTLVLGSVPAWPPLVQLDRRGRLAGVAGDYVARIEDKLGIRFRRIYGPEWAAILDGARERRIDAIAILGRTPARDGYLIFTEGLLELPYAIITRIGHPPVAGIAGLAGKSVAVARGFVSHEWLASDYPELSLVVKPDTEAALTAVALGEAEAYAGDVASAGYLIERAKLGGLMVAADAGHTNLLRIAVRSDWPELARILDKAIAAISPEEHRAIRERWLRLQQPGLSRKVGAELAAISVAAVLAVLLLSHRRLRKAYASVGRMVRERTTELEQASARLRKSEERYRAIFADSKVPMLLIDPADGAIVEANAAACGYYGYSAERLRAMRISQINTLSPEQVKIEMGRADAEQRNHFLFRHRLAGGEIRDVEVHSGPLEIDGRHLLYSIVHDITDQRRAESRDKLRSDILEKLAQGLDLPLLLDAIVSGIEAAQPGLLAAILLEDDEGRLCVGAAPTLPCAVCSALAGPRATCGLADAGREPVYVADVRVHPAWQSCRDAVARAGVVACWSQPIHDSQGNNLACLGVFSPQPALPSGDDLATLRHAASLAGVAIERKRAEKRLRMAMRALETTGESVYWLDVEGHILYVNPAAERELGYSAEELKRMRVSDFDPNVPPEVWGEEGELIRHARVHGLRGFATQHRHRDGHLIPVKVDSDHFLYDGRLYSMAICRDVSARLAAEAALRKSEAKFSAIFGLSPDPIAVSRLADGLLLDVNPGFRDYFGRDAGAVIGSKGPPKDPAIWVSVEDFVRWQDLLDKNGEIIGFESPVRDKAGDIATMLISAKVFAMDGERCVVSNWHDITGRKRYEQHLEEIAHHDTLTGLPNRLLLGDRLRQGISRSRRRGTQVAVCYLDLDGFKAVNDSAGHQVGDRVLVEAADRLAATVRGGDTVARLGGDEFVILLLELAGKEECVAVLERVLRRIAAPYALGGREWSGISASIGVTLFPADPADPDTLIRHADHAMYAAKQAGRNCFRWYDGL